jgi:hypothetical protein
VEPAPVPAPAFGRGSSATIEGRIMTQTQSETLLVNVPVGDRLSELREILVSVDRADEAPLQIRLRLVPDECDSLADLGSLSIRSAHDTPMPFRRLFRKRDPEDYPGEDLGGSD